MPTKADLQARVDELEGSLSGSFGALLAALPPASERTPWVEARAQVALALAKELDGIVSGEVSSGNGPPPNVSAIAKELRSSIEALEDELNGDADPAGFFDGPDVSSAVGNA